MYSYDMLYDATYGLVLLGIVFSLLASAYVKLTFKRFSKTMATSGLTGSQAAEKILRSQGIYDVGVAWVSGNLTDHYNPETKMVNLSDSVHSSSTVAAIAVAAHECGHAIQHAKGYAPLNFRTALYPAANFGSKASWILVMLGIVFNVPGAGMLIDLGILCFVLALLFQIVTLPVEFNASSRALQILKTSDILPDTEMKKARKVLVAAALTYVASVAVALLQLLRLLVLRGGRRRG